MTAKRTQTEIDWRMVTDEDDAGHLTAVTLTRTVKVYPVTSDGRRLWSRVAVTNETYGPFGVGEVPDVMRELTEALTYYANGDRARDREFERRNDTA